MGFRYRKSINFGPVRINLSKSGIGWSVGVKGARFTKKASGGYRTTVGVPGTGVSYVKDYSGKQTNPAKRTDQMEQPYRPQVLLDKAPVLDAASREAQLTPGAESIAKKRTKKNWLVLAAVLIIFAGAVGIGYRNMVSTDGAAAVDEIPEDAVWYPDSMVQFETYPGNVRPGDHVSLSIDSVPRTRHTITVLVDGKPMHTTDLIARETDLTGHAAWDWTVPIDASPGQNYILVTAGEYINCIDYAVLDSAGNVVGEAPNRADPYGYQPKPEADVGEMEIEITPPDTETIEPPVDVVDTPIVEDVPKEAEANVTVYVTDTGTKYHNSGCRHLSESSRAIDLDTAIEQGYTACQACH